MAQALMAQEDQPVDCVRNLFFRCKSFFVKTSVPEIIFKTGFFMFVANAVAFVVLALSVVSFAWEAMAEEPVIIKPQQSILSTECRRSGMQKKVQFLDKNGDGLNDLLQDSDGDGIPDGRICNGSGYGAGRGGFYWQGGGGMMNNSAGNGGSGRGYGGGFRHGGGGR